MLARLQSRGGVEQVDVLSEHLSAGAKTEGGTSAKEERIAGKEKSKARAWDRAVAAPDDAGDARDDAGSATATSPTPPPRRPSEGSRRARTRDGAARARRPARARVASQTLRSAVDARRRG